MSSKTICIRLPTDVVEKIDQMAKKEGVKRSQLIRKLILQSLKSSSQDVMTLAILSKKIRVLFARVEKLEEELRRIGRR